LASNNSGPDAVPVSRKIDPRKQRIFIRSKAGSLFAQIQCRTGSLLQHTSKTQLRWMRFRNLAREK